MGGGGGAFCPQPAPRAKGVRKEEGCGQLCSSWAPPPPLLNLHLNDSRARRGGSMQQQVQRQQQQQPRRCGAFRAQRKSFL